MLVTGQLEGQAGQQGLNLAAIHQMPDALPLLLILLLQQHEAALDEIKLLKGQNVPGFLELHKILGKMYGFQRLHSGQQLIVTAYACGNQLRQLQIRQFPLQQFAKNLAEILLVQLLSRGIDRQDATPFLSRLLPLQHLEGMDMAHGHLSPAPVGISGLARHKKPLAGLQLVLQEFLIEPGDSEETRAVPYHGGKDAHAPPASLLFLQVQDSPRHRGLNSRLQFPNGSQDTLVLIGAGIIGQQVIDSIYAQLAQGFCLLGPHALDIFHRIR